MCILIAAFVAVCRYASPNFHHTAADHDAALLLAGCTSSTSAMSNVYLLSVTYHTPKNSSSAAASIYATASKGAQLTVQSGYFGLCARDDERRPWVCAGGAFGLDSVLDGATNDPLNAIHFAAHFKDDVIFSGLLQVLFHQHAVLRS